MKRIQFLYLIISKKDNKMSISRYINENITYILGANTRKAQRILSENDKVETETHTIYKVYDVDMGDRGGRREKTRDWLNI